MKSEWQENEVRDMAEISLKNVGPYRLAYIEHTGEYGKIPFNDYFGRLYGWVQQRGLRPVGDSLAMYHDDPKKVPLDKCRSEIGVPFAGDARPEGGIKIKDVPGLQVATVHHAGPGSEFRSTYDALNQWIAANGLECAGPSIEVYHRATETVGDKVMIHAEIQVPVRKKK